MDRPPLLFLHGLGGVWQNWLLNIPAFMGTHRVIAPDLPGFGRSEMPAGRISIQGYGRVIDELCRALDVDCPVVIGNSMGGFIGAELALAFPTRVSRLVLVSAAGLSVEHMKKEPLLTLARRLGDDRDAHRRARRPGREAACGCGGCCCRPSCAIRRSSRSR